jgi:hypothetical protein
MNLIEQTVKEIRPWVTFFYLFSLLWIALIILRIPAVPYRWGGLQQSFLFSMLLMALSTFPVSWWLSEKFLGKKALEDPASVVQRIRTGSLMMAALGEASVVYGYALYCLSGDMRWPWMFIGLGTLHYFLIRYSLSKILSNPVAK